MSTDTPGDFPRGVCYLYGIVPFGLSLDPLAFVAYDEVAADTAVDHEGKEEEAKQKYQSVIQCEWFILYVVPGTDEGQYKAAVHRYEDAYRTLSPVAHGKEIFEMDIKTDSREYKRCRDDGDGKDAQLEIE